MPGRKKKKSSISSECPDDLSIRRAFEILASEELGSPVDFELPRCFMKRKSTEYIAIKRNVYHTKRRIEDDGIFCCCNTSPGKSLACDGDCHCGMLFSCCSSSCKCGDNCNNKPFQQRTAKKVKLVQTEKCGLGIIADEKIEKGEFVIEYVGEVIDDKTCEERLWQMKHRGDINFYLCEVNHDMVIDATYKGNRSRFINHSCEPNTEMQKWRVEGETRIGIFAIRDIQKGDELAYDYQFVQFGADQNCFCGSLNCRQTLGNKFSMLEDPYSDNNFEESPNGRSEIGQLRLTYHQNEAYIHNCVGEVIRIWNTQHKRYFGGVISDFDGISRKHIVIFEDGRVDYIDMTKQEWEFCDPCGTID